VRVQAWLIAGTLVAAVFLSNPYAFLPHPARQAGQPKPDFLAFYAAGALMKESPSQLYDAQKQADIQSAALGEAITPEHNGFMPFVYPPPAALLFVPLAWLSYPAAFVGMLVVNVLLFGFAFDLLRRKFQLSIPAGRLIVLSAALSIPVILTLANGQVSFFVFLIVLMLVSDIREKTPRAGFWAGLLAFKPTLLPVFLLRFVMRREWNALRYTALTGSGVVLASLLLVGAEGMADYWQMSVDMAGGRYATVNTANMTNLRSISEYLGFGQGGVILLSLLVMTLAASRCSETSESSCAAVVLAAILVSPHIHYQDLNPLWIAVAIGLGSSAVISPVRRWCIFGGTVLTTAMVFILAARQWRLPFLPLGLLAVFLLLIMRPSTTPQAAAQIPTRG
jgi:hypothetical protein